MKRFWILGNYFDNWSFAYRKTWLLNIHCSIKFYLQNILKYIYMNGSSVQVYSDIWAIPRITWLNDWWIYRFKRSFLSDISSKKIINIIEMKRRDKYFENINIFKYESRVWRNIRHTVIKLVSCIFKNKDIINLNLRCGRYRHIFFKVFMDESYMLFLLTNILIYKFKNKQI